MDNKGISSKVICSELKQTGSIIRALEKRFGMEVRDLGADTLKKWDQVSKKYKNRSINDLIGELWTPMLDEGFAFTQETRENGVQMVCTKCPYASCAKEINEQETGYLIYCTRYYYITKGFNQNIGFKRTRTLMQGDPYCNHFYYYLN